MRIGQGFDVHKFGGEGPVVLGGIEIPHEQGLLAHSDGDVLLHAIADALLGALGEGDIGVWFPDTDPQFKGADSKVLLSRVYQRAHELGWVLGNLDCTVICETPKVNPYRDLIKAGIAKLLATDERQVNVKATTTEKLGFLGRKEGIAAMATVLLVPAS
ncbi:MAG: 2-C-methyl-D-erythritol 2,4-cyclodiphosphate synthase IspF [Idiomarinaceae bacterium HL-53]|nr:MAG: 2-C-methyl-D-erythritol 2,4-cyclodiphosphate synthase IspF [Idiomarinaceae bacterium HL-53]CUS49120.1 2-C-methyl-D-erythritol 2,4-cyclodiphosphate synthase [Idiomarinaceae bacterium HL-53]